MFFLCKKALLCELKFQKPFNIALALLRKAKVYEAISNAILLPDPELKSAISQATLTNHLRG
jgi:hypothetical protein